MMEWLSDMRTQVYFNKIITDYFDSLGIEYNKTAIFTSIKEARAEPAHPSLSRAMHKMISKKNYNRLYKWNKWDMKLYEQVKKIVYDELHSVWKWNAEITASTILTELIRDKPRIPFYTYCACKH